MRIGCLEEKIQQFIDRKKQLIFLRDDFTQICDDYDQVGRALKKMVAKGKLIRVGYGLYAKARKSRISGQIIPKEGLNEIGRVCLKRLRVPTTESRAVQEYNLGTSTQVPTGRVIAVRGRITRKIGYGGNYLTFEKVRRKSA